MNFETTQAIIDRHDRAMIPAYPRYPLAMVKGEGAICHDASGQRYIDLFAGFGGPILGHCHHDLVQAVTHQAQQLWHVGNLFHTEPQTRLAEAIYRHGFGGQSFFCHSGADANEAAIKLARLFGRSHPGPAGPRFKVIAMQGSFHGRSMGTMVATGQPAVSQGFDPLLPGFTHVPFGDFEAVEQAVDDQTVAVMLEPMQGEGGVVLPPDDYLGKLRRLCDAADLMLILDEVWTGCGRTGKYFAHQHWGVEPDAMTLAKGAGGGLALGVMCARPHLAELFNARTQGGVKHATTLGGNCLAAAVGACLFQVLERDRLVERAAELGEKIVAELRDWGDACPAITEVRGKGLFIGIVLDLEKGGFDSVGQVVQRALDFGLIINGTQQKILRLAPPLTISDDLLDEGLATLKRVIAK